MLILLLFLALGGVAVCVFFIKRFDSAQRCRGEGDWVVIMAVIFAFVAVGLLIAICILSTKVVTAHTLDEKILVYQEISPLLYADKIAKLKLESIDISRLKWILYFGR